MAKSVSDILTLIQEQDIKMVDFKMVDINGQYRHVTIPAENFSEDTMKSGIGFDASNYGYAVVEKFYNYNLISTSTPLGNSNFIKASIVCDVEL